MKNKLDESIDNSESDVGSQSHVYKRSRVIPEPTALELSAFYKSLHETGQKPVLLSTIPQYSNNYAPALVWKSGIICS